MLRKSLQNKERFRECINKRVQYGGYVHINQVVFKLEIGSFLDDELFTCFRKYISNTFIW